MNWDRIKFLIDSFNSPKWEASKEVLRWVIFYALGFIVSETLKQVGIVPEWATLHIWVFTYAIPVRSGLNLLLTFAGRFLDKYKYVQTKNDPTVETKGILPL